MGDQGYLAAGAQVLCVDRGVDPFVPVDVPADVDLEAGVRRERADDRPPQVLLISWRVRTFWRALLARLELLQCATICTRSGSEASGARQSEWTWTGFGDMTFGP